MRPDCAFESVMMMMMICASNTVCFVTAPLYVLSQAPHLDSCWRLCGGHAGDNRACPVLANAQWQLSTYTRLMMECVVHELSLRGSAFTS